MKITLRCPGTDVADLLRIKGIECEYADRDFLVLMPSTQTTQQDFAKLVRAIGENTYPKSSGMPPLCVPEKVLSPRQAIFAPWEYVAVENCEGRIAAAPTVGCPPAVPIVVSGERVDTQAVTLLQYYGFSKIAAVVE